MSEVKIIKASDSVRNIKKVAAYCRVSTDLNEQKSSIELQIESYTKIIKEHPDWKLTKIYVDKGLSGTSVKQREQFNAMIKAAKSGRIDIIIAKSISRFARNTLDTLTYTRMLREAGVAVYFESEHIDNISNEFLLTIYAAFAQEESRSISENTKRGIRQHFALGKSRYAHLFGYDLGYKINEDARTVKRIFSEYLNGLSTNEIAELLNAENIPSPERKGAWTGPQITKILKNERYMGDIMMQKYFSDDHLKHNRINNKDAIIDKYYKEDDHAPIIDKETFKAVNRLIDMKSLSGGPDQYPYSGKLICPLCQSEMVKVSIPSLHKRQVWICHKLITKEENHEHCFLWHDTLNRTLENYFGNKVSHKHLSNINTITLCNSTLILNRENETVRLKLLTIKDNENPFYIPEDTRSAKTIENIIKQINEYEVYITENKVLRTRYASHKIPKH